MEVLLATTPLLQSLNTLNVQENNAKQLPKLKVTKMVLCSSIVILLHPKSCSLNIGNLKP
jgi:hypothetical protein